MCTSPTKTSQHSNRSLLMGPKANERLAQRDYLQRISGQLENFVMPLIRLSEPRRIALFETVSRGHWGSRAPQVLYFVFWGVVSIPDVTWRYLTHHGHDMDYAPFCVTHISVQPYQNISASVSTNSCLCRTFSFPPAMSSSQVIMSPSQVNRSKYDKAC